MDRNTSSSWPGSKAEVEADNRKAVVDGRRTRREDAAVLDRHDGAGAWVLAVALCQSTPVSQSLTCQSLEPGDAVPQ